MLPISRLLYFFFISWHVYRKTNNLSDFKSCWWRQGWHYRLSHRNSVTSPGWRLMGVRASHGLSHAVCGKLYMVFVLVIMCVKRYNPWGLVSMTVRPHSNNGGEIRILKLLNWPSKKCKLKVNAPISIFATSTSLEQAHTRILKMTVDWQMTKRLTDHRKYEKGPVGKSNDHFLNWQRNAFFWGFSKLIF